jgi:4-amino-4-deoxy-L-arabinose transferase-like glycosyltransferase
LKWLAVALNVALFAVGLYFEVHPRDRHDVWSAAGVGAVAVLNSAALTMGARGRAGRGLRRRLRRIVLIANGLLAATGLFLLWVEAVHDGWRGVARGLVLVVPPILTIAALEREPPG